MSDLTDRLRTRADAINMADRFLICDEVEISDYLVCADLREAADEIDRLTTELANARAADIHSCHDNCTRAGCVNARLREEIDWLRDAAAKRLIDSTMFTGLVPSADGLTLGLKGGAASLLAEMFAQQFKDGGGINYLQLSFTSGVTLPGEDFIVTVQKCSGKTPHQLRQDAESERDALREEVATLTKIISDAWGEA